MSASSPRANRKRSLTATPHRALTGTVLVPRRVHFNAAHRLDNPGFDVAWNQRTFGACNNPHGHGHNYLLEVSVRGENLVIAFWNEIAPRLKAGKLHRVRLYESERNFAEYCGPDAFAGRS